ncbi:APO protein 3 mitochondrial [Tripterygium wilfordii]|uniref:APO protein 3 mitochondrial n=1 Tax=Tripterygium wilfordii TaxID=458696 RepID=A0A7J7DBL1_TRIWF|nr:APO protein 3, mitochondrial isoform X2 [Tripterygium wilfordii]KAF5743648.1 APO protein 3 mitochondrial [Tripterygium wilfordii]
MQRKIISVAENFRLKRLYSQSYQQLIFFSSERSVALTSTTAPVVGTDDPLYVDIPKPRRDKSERKPYLSPMKELIRRAKKEKEARKAQPVRMLEEPPENGLLVPELVEVAHRVYWARQSLISGLFKLVKVIPVQRCRFCTEVHVGHVGHEIRTCTGPESGLRNATHVWKRSGVRDVVFFPKCFHLYDRVGKPRVGHNERHDVPQIPAIIELCIQAGVDIAKYHTKRRTKPVYSIDGRIVDFESVNGNVEVNGNLDPETGDPQVDSSVWAKVNESAKTSRPEKNKVFLDGSNNKERKSLKDISIETMNSWFEMTLEAKKIMEKYSVWTCGYCPEVQVGPKGHRVRMCKATKHQARDGQHAWQEASMDDIVGPNYVWHVRDPDGPPLRNSLKRYYGKAPAVIELCVQAGAPIPDQYRSMMRLDVIPPDRDEADLVA